MLDEMLVRWCAPTLANLKTGSLFSTCAVSDAERFTLDRRLRSMGLRLLPLRGDAQRTLLYLYRPMRLRLDLADARVEELLYERGYDCSDAERCLARLMQNMTSCSFPHEVGLFLGYPPEDVRGFIENGALHSKCTGCWKVYGDVPSAQRIFSRYKRCTAAYCAQLRRGKTLEELIVRTE